MYHITFAQKKELRGIILLNELDCKNFEFITGEDDREFIIRWDIEKAFYQFKLYYKQVMKSGFIFCQIHSGNSKYSKTHELDLRHVNPYFDRWIKAIKEHISYLDETIRQDGNFSPTLNQISPQFQTIYKQSIKAEMFELMGICGMGYRKSFEFLIKDYLIYLGKMTLSEAQSEMKLQNCINLLNENVVIQKLATHIGYLGNDFCHYYRKWDTKEISDIKEMINILVQWIDTNENYKTSVVMIEGKSEKINETFK